MATHEEYLRWVSSARKTLESAIGDRERGDHNWACFKAQQSSEMAVKALFWGFGYQPRGHSVYHLLSQLETRGLVVPSTLVECARYLDSLYIPTRYADAWSEGAPHEYYGDSESHKAIRCAQKILEWVEETWKEYLRKEKNGNRR